ncbi:MAG: hypothetical protein JXC32_06975 [Anaerolineae bacterium]|nr:hypothetical protein [Anaerolineae bacterium]
MTKSTFPDWDAVHNMPRSPFFAGGKADVAFDQARHADGSPLPLAPNIEALFTQSNARVLLGHAANGMLRFVAMPTQLYAAPPGTGELGLGVGMYHHFDVVMYAGDLAYRLELEGREAPITISSPDDPLAGLDVTSFYGHDFLPVTIGQADGLEITLTTVAPVSANPQSAPLAPAPLPGPVGAIYVLRVRNTGGDFVRGKVVLQAGDLLVGHYEDARTDRAAGGPRVHQRQGTLILSQPYGSVGIHLHDGTWTKVEPPFETELAFELAPGGERVFETYVALGASYADVMPTIYGFHMRSALDWLNLTADYWLTRLGRLTVDAAAADDEARVSRDIYIRSLFDNFNCLQTDADGELLAHWQGAPSHGYGTVWGIDVEPTAVSVAHLCPEITWATLRFFMDRSRVPRGTPDHSVPILVAPIVIARQWLQVTGGTEQLRRNPDVMDALRSIVADLMALKHPVEALFPSKYASDGVVGRRYDYGTNVKVWYAFDSMAYLARHLGHGDEAAAYSEMASRIRVSVRRMMVADGPFGPQISGGTNLGEDPGTFYLAEGVLYYDGEDTSSMLAPIYGMVDFDDELWVNYHRFARSIWCPNFDPEFGALRWSPRGFAGGALDGTGYFSRLGGSIAPEEMLEALQVTWRTVTDEVTGSVFWWPHGLEYKRSLTRCSQGQGAWAWQYLMQWLGVEVDAATRILTLAPRGLLTRVDWHGFRAGPHSFDINWHEGDSAWAMVTNTNAETWTVQVGFRRPGAGATGGLSWQTLMLSPGASATFHSSSVAPIGPEPMDEAHMVPFEVDVGGEDGVLIRRFGPAHLWGHWELEKLWDSQAMPLTIRLLIENGTDTNWGDIDVRLTCPEGWQAAGRRPQHWTRPQAWQREASLSLGETPAKSRTVAPFWVKWPDGLELNLGWHEGRDVPFHATTQPGPGLTLYAANIDGPVEVAFEATVRIAPAGAAAIEKTLEIPLRVLPR